VERAKNHNNNQLTFHPHLTINDGSMHQQRQRGGDAVTTLSSREAAKVNPTFGGIAAEFMHPLLALPLASHGVQWAAEQQKQSTGR